MTALISTSDANDYFTTKLHVKFWTNASEDNRQRSLYEATRIINRLSYIGTKADSSQEHEFPRTIDCLTQTEVPQDILDACCEIAYALLSGIDVQKEYEKIQMHSKTFQSIQTTYDRQSIPRHIVSGVPSLTAWTLLLPYLKDSQEIRINRV